MFLGTEQRNLPHRLATFRVRWDVFPIPHLLSDTNHVINTGPSKVNCVVTSNTDFYSCYIPKAKKPQEKPRTIKEIEEENKRERNLSGNGSKLGTNPSIFNSKINDAWA